MKLLLDSANIDDIMEMMKTSAIKGVTTNPSLMAKEAKGDYLERLKLIRTLVKHPRHHFGEANHFSVEVTTLDPEEMYAQAMELNDKLVGPGIDLFVKIPVTYLETISRLADHNVRVNATACMNPLQAKFASDAGAAVVSFFYGRINDQRDEVTKNNPSDYTAPTAASVIGDFRRMFGSEIKIICGSIRRPGDIAYCALHGVDYVTASKKVINECMSHPQTDKAIRQFQEDIDRWRS